MMDLSRQSMPMYLHPTHIDQDIADLKRLIQYLEMQAYGAARKARAASSSTTATAETLLRKLRAAYSDATRLRRTAMASDPLWAL
jgi:hypothetical protein